MRCDFSHLKRRSLHKNRRVYRGLPSFLSGYLFKNIFLSGYVKSSGIAKQSRKNRTNWESVTMCIGLQVKHVSDGMTLYKKRQRTKSKNHFLNSFNALGAPVLLTIKFLISVHLDDLDTVRLPSF